MSEQRLIDANALPVYQRTIRYNTGEYVQEYVLAYDVRTAPTVDAVEVVHGRWVDRSDRDRICMTHPYVCNRCGRVEMLKEPYCNCGAKMDAEVKTTD